MKSIKSLEEVTAEILISFKQMACDYLGRAIKDNATKRAVGLADLKLLEFITEPCEGAINYVEDKNSNTELLVFDWGGGWSLAVTASENSTGKTNRILVAIGELRLSGEKSFNSIEEGRKLKYGGDVSEEYVYVKYAEKEVLSHHV
ncbi:hypothetical protein JTB14_027413 [Gonioctena quinquepunctata]|nr:hypothetical protein JTB14_027413 [Gonioctena quinquepunctata]